MIGILILTEKNLGAALIAAVVHTLGKHPPELEAINLDYAQSPEHINQSLQQYLHRLDRGEGVLILADMYGATHTNVACNLLQRERIEMITGLNLPMLLRVLNYRGLSMEDLIDKALNGGSGGIICAANPGKLKEVR